MGRVARRVKKAYYVFNGFDCGLKPQRIMHLKKLPNGQMYFLMKWGKTDRPTYIKREDANIKCPSLVIKFYEKYVKLV